MFFIFSLIFSVIRSFLTDVNFTGIPVISASFAVKSTPLKIVCSVVSIPKFALFTIPVKDSFAVDSISAFNSRAPSISLVSGRNLLTTQRAS